MNDDLAERLDAVEEKIEERTSTHTKQEIEATRAALRWWFSDESNVDYNAGHSDAEIMAEAAEHIEEPHATTLRDMLSGSDV